MAVFRLAFAVMVIANVPNLFAPLRLLGDDAYLAAFSTDQLAVLAVQSLDAYEYSFTVALLFFGAHILLLGYLLYRSGYVPTFLGIWLMVGSLGFFAYSFGNLTLPGVEVPLLVVAPSALAELTLLLLLLFNRVNLALPGRPVPAPL